MHHLIWLLVVGTVAVPSMARSADITPAQERAVLDRALQLTGPRLDAHLPFVLTSTLPRTVSRGAEAWTVYDEDGKGERIFLYTHSRSFRCASDATPLQRQCLMKLASVVVHEAWHLRHGPDEAEAYRAQLLFLQMIEATAFQQVDPAAAVNIQEVRRARDRTLSDRWNASTRASTKSDER